MGKGWTFLTQLHSVAGPVLQLLYPLYASVMAIESPSKLDDEQWLAYWIIYSFLTLLEMVIQPALEWLPIWYEVKLVFVAWLVLPQFKGAAFLYDKYVREQILRYRGGQDHHDSSSKSPTGKGKSKFVQFMTPKSVSSLNFVCYQCHYILKAQVAILVLMFDWIHNLINKLVILDSWSIEGHSCRLQGDNCFCFEISTMSLCGRAGSLLKKAEKDIHLFFNVCFLFLLSAFALTCFY